MRIAIFCAGGLSAKTLVRKIIKAAEKQGYTDVECNSFMIGELKEQAPGCDIILLGPQIGFKESKVKELVPEIPIVVINMTDYGLMNGKNIFDLVLKTLNYKDGRPVEK